MNRNFISGLFLGCLLAGCVSAQFKYPWYYVDSTGPLIGQSSKDDLPASTCTKDSQGNHNCVVMKKTDFEAMVQDYMDTQDELNKLQKQCTQ
jgi:hypothetical protein